jgi:N-acetylglucosamine malate deacetylase 1
MKILIVSAHPDDETLGAGGTLFKHRASGDELYWLIVTRVFEEQGYSKELVRQRELEIQKVQMVLQIAKTYDLELPTTKLDSSMLPGMIVRIAEIVKEVNPEIIYLPNHSDIHSDHRITFEAVMACTKSFRFPSIKKILMFECLSETEFVPLQEQAFFTNYFVDISAHFKEKLSLISIYASELGEHPFPRSLRNIEALATFRGATAGVEYAEAFHLIKYIDK